MGKGNGKDGGTVNGERGRDRERQSGKGRDSL